jgi:hypothetical protein
MEGLRLNYKYCCGRGARLSLAGAVAGVCALIASPAPVLAQNFFMCSAQEVAVLPGSRLHVQCDRGDGPGERITYFALSVINMDASRVLSLIETAVVAKLPLQIQYDLTDLSGASIGCATTNCRLIQGVFLQQPSSGGR